MRSKACLEPVDEEEAYAMRRFASVRPGLLLLALAIAIFLWGIASGTSNAERGFDIPVVLDRLPDSLVVTDQNSDSVNVRVMGSRAVLRNIDPENYKYEIDVSGGKPGVAVYDVELAKIDLPRGASFVAHSPSRVQVRFEKKGRKKVTVTPDLEGAPAAGFRLVRVEVDPSEVSLVGARSQVMRLKEVRTEAVDLSGINADTSREVRVSPQRGNVRVESDEPIRVSLIVAPETVPEPIFEEPTEPTVEDDAF
ncbi:MAG: hypothetical protein CMN75_02385 [Spirochaeta sp.]|nr:hypothetical protein [Spirochaeta sp.]RPG13575.1 MAG: YbbR-like domain-containing protein [Proteobacteria bacterium TMED72]